MFNLGNGTIWVMICTFVVSTFMADLKAGVNLTKCYKHEMTIQECDAFFDWFFVDTEKETE
jgi:hypothetical protein